MNFVYFMLWCIIWDIMKVGGLGEREKEKKKEEREVLLGFILLQGFEIVLFRVSIIFY